MRGDDLQRGSANTIRSSCMALVLLSAWLGAASGQTAPDFALSANYLRSLAIQNSIVISLPVRLTHRTAAVHGLAADCEMHLAGRPTGSKLATPEFIVIEPPNLCKFKHESGTAWPDLFDEKVIGRDCIATGFPRIFTEHAANGDEGGANPNHVLEIHPATKITCGNDVISFESYLTVFKGMRAIKPTSANNCVRTRTVSVRYVKNRKRYEFTEDGGSNCGNFVIAEVGYVEPDWVRTVNGGHSAIARVSLDGGSRITLKVYTLWGSDADKWLAKVEQSGQGSERVYLHGMLTYDYFAFVRAVRSKNKKWINPTAWTKVGYPFALVVFGMPETAPWEDSD
jgi:hypothetical protein